jgi:hypothetical protein
MRNAGWAGNTENARTMVMNLLKNFNLVDILKKKNISVCALFT